MPLAIKKALKWKLTTITPIVIRKVLLNSGFRLLKRKFEEKFFLRIAQSLLTLTNLLNFGLIHRNKRLGGNMG